MSNVVAFKPDRKGRTPSAAPGPSGAEILFFTGIRYMRMEDEAVVDAAPNEVLVAVERHAEPGRVQGGREPAERLKA